MLESYVSFVPELIIIEVWQRRTEAIGNFSSRYFIFVYLIVIFWLQRWRRRWFILRNSGELPGQYFLCYYTDRNCRKLKGQIDLDQCEQVDAGLRFESNKQKYQHMFTIRTPKRTYYLAAESEEDMNKWVDCVCHVCGLKPFMSEDTVTAKKLNEDFQATDSWRMRWKEHHGIVYKKLQGEQADADDCKADEWMKTVWPTVLERFHSNNIYNFDETEFYFRTIPDDYNGNDSYNEKFNDLVTIDNDLPIYHTMNDGEIVDAVLEERKKEANNSTFPEEDDDDEEEERILVKRPEVLNAVDLLRSALKENQVEYEGDNISQATTGITEISPPITPSTIITGPYIPISECISGKPINNAEDLKQLLSQHSNNRNNNVSIVSDHRADSYDLPRNLRPPQITVEVGATPPPSPGSESVFTDDESVQKPDAAKKPAVNWETFPRPSDSSVDGEESPGANTATLKMDRKFAKVVASPSAPPRPPKPSHLAVGEAQSDTKIEEQITKSELTQDDLYDMPRSHQIITENDPTKKSLINRHCYSNAAPGHITDNNIFRYDFMTAGTNSDDLPESPHSETGSMSFSHSLNYSNLPSPSYSTGNQIICTPPVVNRDLKPGRKYSDSTGGSNEPSPILTSYPAPVIDRNKKPVKSGHLKKIQETRTADNSIILCSPPVGSLGRRKQRAGPSPTPPNNMNLKNQSTGFATTGRMHRRHSSSDDRLDEVQVCQSNNLTYHPRNRNKDLSKKFSEIQYLDLDLDFTDNTISSNGLVKKSSENVHTPSTATVYKTVDFLKTEAFNRTRIEIEEERSRLCMAAESAL
ncbi:hypothetical protein PGB90_004532 [Kerria lacca]